jgi:hypothetical protein
VTTDPRGATPPAPGAAVDRPVFIVGPHRSGTTLVYTTLAQHPELGCFREADRRFRNSPAFAHFLYRLGRKTKPHECQGLWDLWWPGVDDAMGPADATPEVCRWYRERVRRTLELRGRPRFVAKYPRHSLRLGWLDAVFPGCLFLHVTRDWRAVVHSTAKWKAKRAGRPGDDAYFGVRIPGWREPHDRTPAADAARIYRYVTQHLEGEAARYGDRFRRVSYEDFCARTLDELRGIAGWAGIGWSPAFERVAASGLEARNDSWRTALDPAELDRIRAEDPAFFSRHER